MMRLLQVEWLKIKSSKALWILLGLYVLVVFLSFSNFKNLINGLTLTFNQVPETDFSLQPILEYPDVWHNLTYLATFFRIIPALLIIIWVCDEFSTKTLRFMVINGLRRTEFFAGKWMLSLFLSLFCTLVVGLYVAIVGVKPADPAMFWKGSSFLAAFFLSCLAYFTMAIFISILLKKSGTAVLLLLLYGWLIEPVLSWSVHSDYRAFLPMKSVDALIPFPFLKYVDMQVIASPSIALALPVLVYIIIFSLGSLVLLKRAKL